MLMEVLKKMNNVIDIKQKLQDQGQQEHQEQPRPFPQDTNYDLPVFAVGILVTMVLPTIAYCAFRGPVSISVFAGTALLGTLIGIANYSRFPSESNSGISSGPTRKTCAASSTRPPATIVTKRAA
jgi:hypothetical protein